MNYFNFYSVLLFEAEFHYVIQSDLELTMLDYIQEKTTDTEACLLPQLPEYWECKDVSLCLVALFNNSSFIQKRFFVIYFNKQIMLLTIYFS